MTRLPTIPNAGFAYYTPARQPCGAKRQPGRVRRKLMTLRLLTLVLLVIAAPYGAAAQSNRPDGKSVYYPDAAWQHRTPTESGLDPARLKEATDFAVANEVKKPRDLVMDHYQTFGREPFGYAIGPIQERGDPTGIIIHKGYIVAEWGEPLRV